MLGGMTQNKIWIFIALKSNVYLELNLILLMGEKIFDINLQRVYNPLKVKLFDFVDTKT